MKRLLFTNIILLYFSAVFAASLTISVKLPDGKPAVGAEVIINLTHMNMGEKSLGFTDNKGGITVDPYEAQSRADKNTISAFQLAVKKEKYVWEKSPVYLWAENNDTAQKWLDSTSRGLNGMGVKNIIVPLGEKTNWDVLLAETVTRTVRITDQDGKPIKGLNMCLGMDFFNTIEGEWMNFSKPVVYKTGDDGEFVVETQPHRTYNLYAENNEYIWEEARHTTSMGVNFLFSDKAAPPHFKFIRNRIEEITVRVRDFDTKEPLSGACINVGTRRGDFKGTKCIAKTNKEGAFYTDEFKPEIAEKFGASADGYHEEWLDIDSFSPGGNYEFELKRKSDF